MLMAATPLAVCFPKLLPADGKFPRKRIFRNIIFQDESVDTFLVFTVDVKVTGIKGRQMQQPVLLSFAF